MKKSILSIIAILFSAYLAVLQHYHYKSIIWNFSEKIYILAIEKLFFMMYTFIYATSPLLVFILLFYFVLPIITKNNKNG